MNIQLLLFGIAADLLNTSSINIEVENMISVKELKEILVDTYPQLENIHSYAMAVNEAYATDDVVLKENDIVAIIPPVSGG
jgi:molybdopterin converting factor subunit 1